MIVFTGAKEDGDAIDVKGGAETMCDGFEQWGDFGEVSSFVGELGEKLLGRVGLTKEALVNLLLKAFREDKAEDKEPAEEAEDAKQIYRALMTGSLIARKSEIVTPMAMRPVRM